MPPSEVWRLVTCSYASTWDKALRSGKITSFRTLLGVRRSRLDVVVTFLAMLELVKRHFVSAKQESLFGDITLETSNEWDDDLDFELEFGE